MTSGLPVQNPSIKTTAGWITVLALISLAYWRLIAFDPQEGVFRPAEGIEGTLFEPTGQAPLPVLALVAWMVWRRRALLVERTRPNAPLIDQSIDFAFFLGAAVIACWSTHVGAPDLLVFSLQLLLFGVGGTLGGGSGRRAMWLPAFALLLAVPIPPVLLNELVFDLQIWIAETCSAIARFFGEPAQVLGVDIVTSQAVFRVIEGCTGIRITTTLVMATFLYAELSNRTEGRSVVLLLCAPVVGFGVNLVRVLTIMGNPYSEIAGVHSAQGVVMVVVAVLLIVAIDDAIGRFAGPARRVRDGVNASELRLDAPFRRVLSAAALIGLVVLLTPRFEPSDRHDDHVALSSVPRILFGERSMGLSTDVEFLGSVSFTDRIDRGYGQGDEQVRVFVGESTRTNRRGSILSEKTSYPGSRWQLLRRERIEIEEGILADLSTFQSATGLRQELHWREDVSSFPVEVLRNFAGVDQSRFADRAESARVFRVGASMPAHELDTRDRLVAYAKAIRSPFRTTEVTNLTSAETTARTENRDSIGN